jgi:hypothetical protein
MADGATEDPTIKKIVLTANTTPIPTGGEIKRRKSRRAARGGGDTTTTASSPVVVNKIPATGAVVGGGATSPGTLQQLAASHIPGSNSSKAVGAIAPLTVAQATIGKVAPAAANDPVVLAPAKGGATTDAKVTLVKSRKAARRVMLAAAKPSTTTAAPRRKTAKKLKVSLSGLGKRLHHARTIRKGASKKSLDEIKKALTEAKLVKPDTKAPEDILRQMYADYMTLRKKAL